MIKPPPNPREQVRRAPKHEIFTFGYQFTIAAIRRGAPDTPLMLFESPVFRTASLRAAGKIGLDQSDRKKMVGPGIGAVSPGGGPPGIGPDTPVPYWDETFHCTTLPERFDFDLDPGTYDVYIAFDIMNRDGGWAHRTYDYQTDLTIEASRQTRLDGVASMGAGEGRELTLLPASHDAGAKDP